MRLLRILYSAFINTENLYRSFVGNKVIDNITKNTKSEINKNHWSIKESLVLLSKVFIPSIPIKCPLWMPEIIKRFVFGGNSEYLEDNENEDERECFIYINGMLTNKIVLNENKKLLKKYFNRPINLLFNNTDSIIMDLIECLIGKTTNTLTESSFLAVSVISKKILDPNIYKVVIICHSQGTIIMSQVLNRLKLLGFDKEVYMKKLEIYAFANCSTNMKYLIGTYPYIEHFANENDFVAKLGCNCAQDVSHLIDIDGIRFVKLGKAGHMLNSHYLDNFQEDFPYSKLNNYIIN